MAFETNRTKSGTTDEVKKTLHDSIQDWVNLPWAGDRYLNIAEQLWDSLEAVDLIEGPFGSCATLLESCILDAIEGLNAGNLDEEQAVERLADLLEFDDFAVGARVIEVRIGANSDIKITNMDQLQEEGQPMYFRTPQWWKHGVRSYWLLIGVIPFVAMLIVYIVLVDLGIWAPPQILAYVVITPPFIASAYYIRTVQSQRLWRVLFILLGSCFIGCWFIMLPLALIFGPLIRLAPFWLGFPFFFGGSLVLGGFIGDWLGKRRDYRPYM